MYKTKVELFIEESGLGDNSENLTSIPQELTESVENQLGMLNYRYEAQLDLLQSKLMEDGEKVLDNDEESGSHPDIKVQIMSKQFLWRKSTSWTVHGKILLHYDSILVIATCLKFKL